MEWATFFLAGWGAGFTAYLTLQVLTLCVLKRPIWYLALLPLIPMAFVVVMTLTAYLQASNLWPIVMIFASPLAVLYLLVVGISGVLIQVHPKRRMLVTVMVGVSLAACVPYVLIFSNPPLAGLAPPLSGGRTS